MRLNTNSTAFTAFCTCNFKKCQETVLTKLTKLLIMRLTLSSAVAYVELKPFRVFLVGLFFGATSGIFSMMISALGFSGSSPQ
jgi:hypothetical protein